MTSWTDYQDNISDAISDSMDVDWSANDGARAVVAWLNENKPLSTTPRVTVPVEPTEAMRLVPDRVLTETLYWMARAYERVHSMPRVSDTELANKIEAAKADLGRARDASPILSNSAAPAPEGGVVSPQVYRLLQLADAALANVTAFEADARYIMGNTNYAITDNARSEIRQFLVALATHEEAPADNVTILITKAQRDAARNSGKKLNDWIGGVLQRAVEEAPAEAGADDDDASTYRPSIAGLSDYLWNQALGAESVESRCILEMWREAVDSNAQTGESAKTLDRLCRVEDWAQAPSALRAQPPALTAAFMTRAKHLLDLAEKAEDDAIDGDEGCVWPVEALRVAYTDLLSLATREEAPAEAGELVGLIDYLENMRAETVTDEGREIMSEWINALRAQPPAREDDWTPFELKPNDIANIIDRHADCGDDGLHNASQLAELIYQAGKKYDTHPAPDALRVAVPDRWLEAARYATERGLLDYDRNIRRAEFQRIVTPEALADLQAEQKGGA